jgi:hypothetical protein
MKRYKELHIRCPVGSTDVLIQAIDAALTKGWTRARDAEKRARELRAERDLEFAYYYCDQRAKRKPGMLLICRLDPKTLHVADVKPTPPSELSFAQYNAILTDFHNSVLRRVRGLNVRFLLTSDNAKIEDMIAPETFRLLKEFSSVAKKSTEGLLPPERRRWIAFLVAHQSEKHRLDKDLLWRWLVEVEEWPEEMANELRSEFNFAVDLLDFARMGQRSV